MLPEINWTDGVIDFRNDDETGPTARILFLGDLCPAGRVEGPLLTEEVKTIFGGLLEHMQSSDIAVFNLEAPLTSSASKIRKSGRSLKANPNVIRALKEAGLNVACLANNHILDYGLDGAKETWVTLATNSITPIGVGKSKKAACGVKIVDANGIRVGIINSAEAEYSKAGDNSCGACDHSFRWHNSEMSSIDDVDLKVAVLHGGKEYFLTPPPHTYSFFEELKSLGFNLIIGHHPHVPQGVQIDTNSFIAYSLGNVLFDPDYGMFHPLFRYGFGVLVTCSARKLLTIEILPYRVKNGWKLELLKGKSKEKFLQMLKRRSSEVEDRANVERLWSQFATRSSQSTYLPALAGKTIGAYAQGSLRRLIAGLVLSILSAIRGFFYRSNDNEFLFNTIATTTHREFLLENLRRLQKEQSES